MHKGRETLAERKGDRLKIIDIGHRNTRKQFRTTDWHKALPRNIQILINLLTSEDQSDC